MSNINFETVEPGTKVILKNGTKAEYVCKEGDYFLMKGILVPNSKTIFNFYLTKDGHYLGADYDDVDRDAFVIISPLQDIKLKLKKSKPVPKPSKEDLAILSIML